MSHCFNSVTKPDFSINNACVHPLFFLNNTEKQLRLNIKILIIWIFLQFWPPVDISVFYIQYAEVIKILYVLY
jgi:hypothetical protein